MEKDKEPSTKAMKELFRVPIPTLVPLFWLKTEDESIIRQSIARMGKAGAAGFILENRDNPLYLSERWWELVAICLNEAKQRSMKLWLWDEKFFPSGTAGGAVMRKNTDFSQKVIEEKAVSVDNYEGMRLPISEIAEENEVFAIFACKQDQNGMIQAESLVKLELSDDMLEKQKHKDNQVILIYLVKRRSDWVDVLNPDATQTFIDLVYEEAYRRFHVDFGDTFAGFFSDETGTRNVYNYYSLPGKKDEPLPWTWLLCKVFAIRNGYKLEESLPALWHDIGESTRTIRRDYMDTVSHLFAENFFGKIHDWCGKHGVQFIGHVIEDNGAHYRLGHGCAHYFRVMEKFHIPGVDIVLKQVLPDVTEQKTDSAFEVPFFYWVLAKLASSASHIYNIPENLALLESFGAYGWYEGLRMIKWLTDWAIVRGINVFTPHAFNPRFPDGDCPPHFGLERIDPQWQHFNIWSDYANRMSQLLRGGRHIAPVALLYTAESLWTGDAEPIEDTAKSLLQSQIDFDFVPYDSVMHNKMTVESGKLHISDEYYGCLVVPPVHALSLSMLQKLYDLASERGKIVFVKNFPKYPYKNKEYNEFQNVVTKLKLFNFVKIAEPDALIPHLLSLDIRDIEVSNNNPNLRYVHRVKGNAHIFMFFNESLHENVNTEVVLCGVFGQPERWDPMNGDMSLLGSYKCVDGKGICIPLFIEPYQSLVIFVSDDGTQRHQRHIPDVDFRSTLDISNNWRIEVSDPKSYPSFREEKRITGLGDFSNIITDFAGTVAYEKEFCIIDDLKGNSDFRSILDLGEAYETVSIFVNSHKATTLICPPYRCDISRFIRMGRNCLRVEVTSTLANAVKDIDEHFSGKGPFPFGLIGPVKLISNHKVLCP